MKTKAFVIRTEGNDVWLSIEAESCSICEGTGHGHASCAGCGCREAFDTLAAKNRLGLPLEPGMKVAASFTPGRAIIQAAASLGLPLVLSLAAYLAAPALPPPAKPVSALAAFIAAALLACAGSALIKKKFPRAYGDLEVTEILEYPPVLRFPADPERRL